MKLEKRAGAQIAVKPCHRALYLSRSAKDNITAPNRVYNLKAISCDRMRSRKSIGARLICTETNNKTEELIPRPDRNAALFKFGPL